MGRPAARCSGSDPAGPGAGAIEAGGPGAGQAAPGHGPGAGPPDPVSDAVPGPARPHTQGDRGGRPRSSLGGASGTPRVPAPAAQGVRDRLRRILLSPAAGQALRRWEATVRPRYPHLDPRLLRPDYRFPLPRGSYRLDRDTFGDPRHWTPSGPRPRPHQGNDLLAARGTPVRSVGPGRVLARGWSPYGGWFILVELAGTGYFAYYSHLDRYAPEVRVGQRVRAGQVLGYVGNTGYGPPGTRGKFWPHLHFELRRQGRQPGPVNPYPYLRYWEALEAAEGDG